MKNVYLDHAATTPVAKEVMKAMQSYFTKKFGNASEPHLLGREAREAIEKSRLSVARFFKTDPHEIIFTGSATESINLAIKGLVEAIMITSHRNQKLHLITSAVEHKAVLETCKHLQLMDQVEVTYLLVDQYGQIRTEDLLKSIRKETALVSVMYVNNEIGTIQPIPEIGKMLKEVNLSRQKKGLNKIYFHTDATQAIQYLNCQVDYLGVDLLSLAGHKLSAPKGIGVLYKKEGTPLTRQVDGGGQEFGLRAGTENVAFIVGLAKAIELVFKRRQTSNLHLQKLQKILIENILKIPGVRLTGHPTKRAPHIASFLIEGVEGEALILLLSEAEIMASTGSACTSQTLSPSHVLTAMQIPPEISHGSLRISLGKDTTEKEIKYLLEVLPKVVKKLRRMAPKLNNFTFANV